MLCVYICVCVLLSSLFLMLYFDQKAISIPFVGLFYIFSGIMAFFLVRMNKEDELANKQEQLAQELTADTV